MSIAELLPSVATLSHADKFKLMQIILQQLAQENEAVMIPKQANTATFDSRRYFGIAHQTKQMIDDYLIIEREGWNSHRSNAPALNATIKLSRSC
jgi:hypothetical protein